MTSSRQVRTGWRQAVGAGAVAMMACSLVAVSSGCRAMGGLMGSKDAQVRSGTVWNVPAPEIPPPAPEKRTAYVSVRNISDADTIELRDEVREAIQAAGYTLVADPTQANFRLRATIRYFGENEAADEGRALANRLGSVGGAATGVAAGVGTAHLARAAGANRSLTTGVGIGAGLATASLASTAMSNRMKVREWNLIVDLVLEEKLDKPIKFTVASDRSVTSRAHTGAHTGRAGVDGQTTGGSAHDRTRTSAAMERESDYFPHGVRLTAWARQIGMREHEALPVLKTRIRNVLPRIMPE